MTKEHGGQCLCGHIRYTARGKSSFPHLCSCRMCQRWSGAPTIAWVEFPWDGFEWTGAGGSPTLFQSSDTTQRGHCAKCGSTICAIDDGRNKIAITMATLDDPSRIIPGKQHSFVTSAPAWWAVSVSKPAKGTTLPRKPKLPSTQ
jgi:hypothetical protein